MNDYDSLIRWRLLGDTCVAYFLVLNWDVVDVVTDADERDSTLLPYCYFLTSVLPLSRYSAYFGPGLVLLLKLPSLSLSLSLPSFSGLIKI